MLKFFRNIRQSLFSENKVTQYLLHALGEVALVMIGILLAVQVNAWNQERNDRKEEQQVLKQLKTEFEANLDQINHKIFLHQKKVESGLKILVINDLINSGKPYLICNDELRQLISGWSGDIDAATEEELIWRKVRDEAFIPYLNENLSLRIISIAGVGDVQTSKIVNFGKA